MNARFECMPCLLQSTLKLFDMDVVPDNLKEEIYKNALQLLHENNFNHSPPFIARQIHRMIKDVTGIEDLYKQVKETYNSLAARLLQDLEQNKFKGADDFYAGLKLAIIGNVIDFGIDHSFDLEEITARFDRFAFAIDHSKRLLHDIQNAKTILYIADNAGEIVFDAYFLKIINHPRIFCAVRGAPILNDVTMVDAKTAGIDNYATIIDTGHDIPGVNLAEAGECFKEIYNEADFIIAKGQGNYETLGENMDKKIYFLMMVKCDCVARELQLSKGDIIVKCNMP